jgi:23S rRNA (uracil1939-C5)-methyltransferase
MPCTVDTLLDTQPIIGIFQKRSHVVIAHKDCKIQPSIYDEIVTEFLAYIEAAKVKIYDEKTGNGNLRHLGFRKSAANGQIIVVIVTKNRKLPFTKQLINNLTGKFPQIIGIIQNINSEKGNAILGKDEKILFGKDYLIETIGKISYHLNYRSFFQINHSTTEKLYDFVKSQISKNEIILDAYSGVGTIGIYLADKAKEVIGVEFVAAAVKDAKQNIEFNNIDNCRYYVGLVEDKIEEICKKTVLDTIIFDPPRKGLEKKIIEVLKHNEIKKVIYVSCNPMTQKRDVHMLNEIGYKIKKIQPFDMFPQTWHIENVVVLEK